EEPLIRKKTKIVKGPVGEHSGQKKENPPLQETKQPEKKARPSGEEKKSGEVNEEPAVVEKSTDKKKKPAEVAKK
ncbi:hypothetical protein LINPERHAP2_LOCUS25366, partial [Linum perenne]